MFQHRDKCFNENGPMHSQTTYGYNVIFLCYMSNIGIMIYRRAQNFFEIFPKTFMQKRHL